MMNISLRQSFVLAMGVCVSASVWAAGNVMELNSETDKTSYALGYQIGGDFRRQKLDLNAPAVVRGIADAQTGATPLMTEERMRTTLMELKQKVVAQERAAIPEIDKVVTKKGALAPDADHDQPGAQGATTVSPHARRASAKETENSSEFLAKNAKRDGVVSLPSGVQYKILKNGTGKRPRAEDKVALIYRGSLIDGNEFGNTDQGGKPVPRIFPLAMLVPGVREAVSHMKAGAQWQVFVPPHLGFDASTPLCRKITVFDVELVAVNP